LRRSISIAALALLLCVPGSSGFAADASASKEQMQSLDEQVQEIKSDVLSIAAELGRLEEKLLYPSNTQVAVFVSLEEGETLQLDSVRIQIDGELAVHHIYSFKELEALQKGGVQRIYTGNVATGEHRLEVSVSGKSSSGKDVSGSQTFTFSKDVEPKLVGISLARQDFGDVGIRLGSW
jgi:type II secretory pathway pseudopilin PulG